MSLLSEGGREGGEWWWVGQRSESRNGDAARMIPIPSKKNNNRNDNPLRHLEGFIIITGSKNFEPNRIELNRNEPSRTKHVIDDDGKAEK